MAKTKIDIRRAIEESGVSLAQIAERTGMDRSNVSKLWSENANPTYNKLLAVANAIDKDITELFYPIEESSTQNELLPTQTLQKPDHNRSASGEDWSNNAPTTVDADLFSQNAEQGNGSAEGAQVGFFVFGGKRFKIVECE